MDHVLLVAVAATLVGLAVLAGVAEATAPRRVPLADAPRYADRTVVVEARALAVEPLAGGSTRLTLVDGERSLPAFVRGAVSVLAGDTVEATGRVAKYHGQWELVVDEPDDVVVLVPWTEGRVPVAALAAAPWEYVGTNVRTVGLVEEDGGTWLRDPATPARVRVSGLDHPASGGPVRVDGVVVYDEDQNRFRLRVEAAGPVAGP